MVIKTGDVTAVEGEGKKPVSMIDRVVMYTPVEPFVGLPPPRTPKRLEKTGDRSVRKNEVDSFKIFLVLLRLDVSPNYFV